MANTIGNAINIQSKDEGVQMVNLRGKRFDCGSVEGFIQATNYEYNKRKN